MNITKHLKQIAVYWGNPQNNGYGGFTYDEPVEIKCRWEKKREVFVNDRGEQEVSSSVVYPPQELDLNGYLYLGRLTDLDSTQEGNPMNKDGAFRVKGKSSVPNLKATQYVHKVWL